MSMDVKTVLQDLGKTAAAVADDAKRMAAKTGKVVAEKSAAAKTSFELAGLRNAQERIFADAGRVLYTVKTGDFDDEEGRTAQQKIDELLLAAEQKQQEIDRLQVKLHELNGHKVCEGCGKVCNGDAVFCPACGDKLK